MIITMQRRLMKNIFFLSIKKLKEDLPRSVVLICCIVLLSVMMIILGNICQYININFESLILDQVNENGMDLELKMLKKDSFENKDLQNNINAIESIGKNFAYAAAYSYDNIDADGKDIILSPYFAFGMLEELKIIEGESVSEEADAENYIWLSQTLKSFATGDTFSLNVDGAKKDFIVKGIVQGESSYIDYRNLKIDQLYCRDISGCDDFSVVKKLNKLYKNFCKYYGFDPNSDDPDVSIYSSIVSLYESSEIFYSIAVILCVFLIAVTLALTTLGLSNAVKINTDKNRKFFGILKSQGLKDKGIMLYNLFLWIIYIALGVIAATVISSVILHFSLGYIISTFFGLLDYSGVAVITGFCWWLPFVCIIVMFGLCMLMAISESKRLAKIDVAEMLKGEE